MSIRVATPADGAAVAAVYAPYVRQTAISFEDEPPSAQVMSARIAATLETHPYLVFEQGGEILGYAYAGRHKERAAYRWSVDVAIYVTGSAHGRGIGRSLYAALLDLLRRQGFHAAYAGIVMGNAASIGLHETMGFRHIGTFSEVGFKLGAWHDVGWWELHLSQAPPDGDPIPFSTLR